MKTEKVYKNLILQWSLFTAITIFLSCFYMDMRGMRM